MQEKEENVFGYIDDLDEDELCNLQEQLIEDIEYLKQINDRKSLNFEIERLRYLKKVLETKKEKELKTI